MNTKSIMIVGVGGQGTLLASKILGNLFVSKGFDVKVSEVHGMSQRGGSVVTYVRYGENVNSPIVDFGCADMIIAFEELEAYRWNDYLKEDGVMIVNAQNIMPMPVITGACSYPTDITSKLRAKSLVSFDATQKAIELGNVKALNVLLLGVLASKTDFTKEEWLNALKETVPAKFLELNTKAFLEGYNYAG